MGAATLGLVALAGAALKPLVLAAWLLVGLATLIICCVAPVLTIGATTLPTTFPNGVTVCAAVAGGVGCLGSVMPLTSVAPVALTVLPNTLPVFWIAPLVVKLSVLPAEIDAAWLPSTLVPWVV